MSFPIYGDLFESKLYHSTDFISLQALCNSQINCIYGHVYLCVIVCTCVFFQTGVVIESSISEIKQMLYHLLACDLWQMS